MLHNDSGHRAIVLWIEADPRDVKRYVKTQTTIPVPPCPLKEIDAIFEQLVKATKIPTHLERPENA